MPLTERHLPNPCRFTPDMKINSLSLLSLLLIAQTSTAWSPSPFEAKYKLQRNGKEAAQTIVALKPSTVEGEFDYSSNTEGSRGIAALLGGEINQHSHFRWKDDQIIALDYRYRQKVAFKKRRRNTIFDWQQLRANGTGKKGPWEIELKPGVIDPLLVNLAMMQDRPRPDNKLTYTLIEKGREKSWRFQVFAGEQVETPAGSFATVKLQRLRSGSSRETLIWLAPDLNYLAVKILQTEGDDETLSLLVSTTVRPSAPPVAKRAATDRPGEKNQPTKDGLDRETNHQP